MPRLSKLPGFSGYHLIEAGDGVMTSIGFFDTEDQADASTKVASTWIRDEKLEKALPNPPRITRGEIVAHRTRELVQGVVARQSSREGPPPRAFCRSEPRVAAIARPPDRATPRRPRRRAGPPRDGFAGDQPVTVKVSFCPAM